MLTQLATLVGSNLLLRWGGGSNGNKAILSSAGAGLGLTKFNAEHTYQKFPQSWTIVPLLYTPSMLSQQIDLTLTK